MKRNHKHRKHHDTEFKRRATPGAEPGTLIIDPEAAPTTIHILAYDPHSYTEKRIETVEEINDYLGKWPVIWINVDGLGDAEVLQRIGQIFDIHRLALEDVANVHQRSKVEPFDNQIYIVTRGVEMEEKLETEQISLILGRNYVITFQERAGDCFDPIRERIRNKEGRIRKAGADYLTYVLLDINLDHYFPILEKLGERLEDLEDEVLARPDKTTIARIHAIKRELIALRRSVWPQREAINTLIRDPSPLILDETRIYLRDCYDHAIQIIDLVESYREVGSDLIDIYLSSASNRMNEIMKVLTMISTLFIPLTFIVGVYGMNFNTSKSPWNMPELEWAWGYPACLALMAAITIGMMFYFQRRGWIRFIGRRK